MSSSGHLELAKYILGDDKVPAESLMMTVVLHFGTALATVYVFRKEILNIIQKFFSKDGHEEKSYVWKIIISMIPAAIIGVLFEKQLEALFTQNILLVCAMLVFCNSGYRQIQGRRVFISHGCSSYIWKNSQRSSGR